jgi:hypothetical protein
MHAGQVLSHESGSSGRQPKCQLAIPIRRSKTRLAAARQRHLRGYTGATQKCLICRGPLTAPCRLDLQRRPLSNLERLGQRSPKWQKSSSQEIACSVTKWASGGRSGIASKDPNKLAAILGAFPRKQLKTGPLSRARKIKGSRKGCRWSPLKWASGAEVACRAPKCRS